MPFSVSGAADLFRVAAALTAEGNRGLRKELDRGCDEAAEVIVDEVRQSLDKHLPTGYTDDFRAGFRTRVEKRLSASRRLTLVFWSGGRLVRNRRDIVRINAGTLRKPVRGRTRRLRAGGRYMRPENAPRVRGGVYVNPWAEQKVKPGLVDVPFRRAEKPAVQKVDDAVRRVAERIEKAG